MPKLPSPENINRKIASPGGVSGQLRGTMIPDVAPDTAIADALGNIGDDIHKYQMKEKARMDQVAFDDAKNQYMQRTLELKKEVAGIKGKDAVDRDIDKEYTTKLDGISETISLGLKNNTQKDAWNSYFGTAKTQFRTGVMKHKLSESDSYAQTTNTATIATNQPVAIANPSNGRIVQESADAIKVSVARELIRSGNDQDPDIVKYKMNNALSPLWHGVITAQIDDGKYGTATKLLEEKREILGEDYGTLLKSMEVKKITEESQNIADDVFATVNGDQAQINKIRETYSGDLEELALKQIKIRQDERDAQIITEGLRKKQDKADAKNAVIEWKNQIANDLFEFEKNGDNAGRLAYIEKIPSKFGDLKRKELDKLEADMKKSKKETGFNEAENKLRDKITFEPEKVTKEEIRSTGQNANNRVKLSKMYEQATQKGEVQKNVESRVKTFAEDILKADDGVLWFGLSDEAKTKTKDDYYKHLDTIREYFKENPNTTYEQANTFYNTLIKPEIAKEVINMTVNKTKPTKQVKVISKKDYPEKGYNNLIKTATEESGVPFHIAYHLVKAESNFNPDAVSKKGAKGIMQFMDATAKDEGVNALDPKSAIPGGMKYLKKQYDEFGTWELALAAYNAGPAAVKKYGGIPPFKETQDYVKKIMGDYAPGIKTITNKKEFDALPSGEIFIKDNKKYRKN